MLFRYFQKNYLPILLLVLLISQTSHASSGIYKVTDEHGNIIYTNIAPSKQKGQAEQIDIKQPNISHEGEHLPGDDDTFFEELRDQQEQVDEQRRQRRQERQAAYEALQQAKEDLEKAKELRPTDYRTNINGGIRYRPEYHERIEAARQRLEAAERAYEQLH